MLLGVPGKPGYHGTGSARSRGASSTASEARAGRAAEKRKSRSNGTESSINAREARASLVASRRAWTIAGRLSHARSARALGRLRWEPPVHFLSVSLVAVPGEGLGRQKTCFTVPGGPKSTYFMWLSGRISFVSFGFLSGHALKTGSRKYVGKMF